MKRQDGSGRKPWALGVVPALVFLGLGALGFGQAEPTAPQGIPGDSGPEDGGSVTVFLPASLPSLNFPLYTSSQVRGVMYEVHETLLVRNKRTLELEPRLARSWQVEDRLVLAGGEAVLGQVEERAEGYLVRAGGEAERLVPKDRVERLERGTVITVDLRSDVLWHDGHGFDAGDVVFSHSIYGNPDVDCDRHRSLYARIERVERLGDQRVRFHYDEPYFKALGLLANLTLLPSHLFDLRDPDHADHDPEVTDKDLAQSINANPHNTDWVGVGPYRIVSHEPTLIVARRFEDYFDPAIGGHLDEIRWRHLPINVNFQALLNDELDFSAWLTSDQYLVNAASDDFQGRFRTGSFYLGSVNYTPWNTRRPLFADPRVRRALAHAFDMEAYGRDHANGLGIQPTAFQIHGGPAYDMDVEPLAHDPKRAAELLAEAGWYDRDGDGIVDRDGVPFVFEYMAVAGHVGEATFAQSLQEQLANVGVKMEIAALEYATLDERLKSGDFDATGLAMTLPPETDPESIFHSKNADLRGSNRSGLRDGEVDRLIEAGRIEMDDGRRYDLWKALQRRIHDELQPVLFRLTPPRKYALRRGIGGFESLPLAPGFSIREWYLEP